jgi:hypothetical protein
MGAVKRYLEEVEARGWADVGKLVCSMCLLDYALIDAVRQHGAADRCDYCKTSPGSNEASAPLELVLSLIVDGFRSEYEDPVEQVLYSSADGGYQMPLDDTWDLLESHEVTENGDLINDMVAAIRQDAWVPRDPYAASPSQALQWGWSEFRTFVKHHRRYTFLDRDESVNLGAGEIRMHSMPEALAQAIELAGRVRVLPAGTNWWRVRVHPPGERHRTAAAIGAPPDEVAKDNRMTAKGIGAFYGASSASTARAEVSDYAKPTDEGTLGRFALLRDVSVVDLTGVDDVPSIFDAAQRHRRAALVFMREFVADVTKIADPSDWQNLDYIPTQVVAEFTRFRLRGAAGPVGGVLWRSSKDPLTESCVLFAGNAQMADQGAQTTESWLLLDPRSVQTISAPL